MSVIHIATEFWQEETIVEALKRFNADERIKALAVFGSYGASPHLCDEWSDLDLFLVVEDGALPEFASGVKWVEEFGELYAYEQSANSFSSTTRCCFRDGRKIDFVAALSTACKTLRIGRT